MISTNAMMKNGREEACQRVKFKVKSMFKESDIFMLLLLQKSLLSSDDVFIFHYQNPTVSTQSTLEI